MNQNLYYRPNRRSRKRSRRGVKRNLSYLLPFLYIAIFIFVIYMLVLGVKALIFGQIAKSNNVVTAYLDTGRAQVLLAGEDMYSTLLSGQKLKDGDRLQVLKDSRVVLEIFEASTIRLDEGSDLLIEKIDSSSNSEDIRLKLNAGKIWVNKGQNDKPKSTMELSLNYEILKVSEAVFEAKSSLPEHIRVFEGSVFVDILESLDDKINVLDSFTVGVGQEMLMTNQDYDMFKQRETPSVLGELDSAYKKEEWYKWNIDEDTSPTVYEVDPALEDGESGELVSENPIDLEAEFTDLSEGVLDDPSKSEAPKFISPEENSIVTKDLIDITGTVPEGTQQVMITSFEDPIPNPYILKGFKPGDRSWRYIAAFQDGDGNLVVGENKYEVVAIDENGKESNKAVLTFIFTPEEGSVSNSESLELPEIVSLDGVIIKEGQAEAERNEAFLQGVIGSWAEKVYVNDFELTEFVPFSNDWSYVLSTELGTLKEGENYIQVYGQDANGVNGPVASVNVKYMIEEAAE